MNGPLRELGVLTCVIEQFFGVTYPRALRLRRRLENGGAIEPGDWSLIHKLERTNGQSRTLIERHPEYRRLAAKILTFERDVLQLVIEVEQRELEAERERQAAERSTAPSSLAPGSKALN